MDVQALQNALVGWARGVAGGGVTVYYGEPNGPRPLPPSVRLKLVGGPAMLGLDSIKSVAGNPNDFTVEGPRNLMLSVTAIGDTALQLAANLQTSLSDPNVQATLDAANLSALVASDIRDVSELIDTKWEQRRQFDVTLLAYESVTTQPGVIEHVHGTGTIPDAPSIPISVDKT